MSFLCEKVREFNLEKGLKIRENIFVWELSGAGRLNNPPLMMKVKGLLSMRLKNGQERKVPYLTYKLVFHLSKGRGKYRRCGFRKVAMTGVGQRS